MERLRRAIFPPDLVSPVHVGDERANMGVTVGEAERFVKGF